MSFTSDVKNEILSTRVNGRSAQRALFSAAMRTCGSIETSGDKLYFSLSHDDEVLNYFIKIAKLAFGADQAPKLVEKKGERALAVYDGDKGLELLIDLGILSVEDGEVNISLGVGELVKTTEEFKAYAMGAFLGSGSLTVPEVERKRKTGYHLEIVFSKYYTAADFASLLAEHGFFPKLVERKEQFVVYFKNAEEISNFVGLCGANTAYLKLTELQIKKEIRNAENRKLNCEMSNMTKTIDASIKQREDIKLIADCVGLDALKAPLKEVALARLNNAEMSTKELADSLSITKSCLNHRLKKLSEIAASLR